MFAAVSGYPEVIYGLLELGADVSATDKFGKMALHHGCRGGSLDNVRTILENITD